jgi:hypothetical protein
LLRPTNAKPVTYRIRVQGALDNSQTARITGMQVDTEAGEDVPISTTLTGALRDEAELAGVLDRLYALGLPLISVERDEPDQSAPAGAAASREVDEPDQLT